MKQTVLALTVTLMACAWCSAQDGGKPEQVITTLKSPCRETTIVAGGQPNATIVIPEGEEYGALGLQVQKHIAEASGVTLPLKLHTEVEPGRSEQHLILLGNMDNNRVVERLYWQRYVAADLDYPGPDGYEVRTACDPWGTGKNAIMLGGSSLEGVRAAVEALTPMIRAGADVVVPMLLDIRIRGLETIDEARLQSEWEYYKKEIIGAAGLWYGVEQKVHRLAYDYYLTGIEEYARIYNEVIKRWMEEYYRFTADRQLVTPKYDMPDMFLSWDLIEESPSITDDVRLEMTNLLYDYAIRMGEGPRVRNWEPGRMRLEGHVPLLSVVYGHAYFAKHYPNAPLNARLQAGRDNVQVAMDSYAQTVGFMSETGYLGTHPELLTYYSQYTGDARWFETRNALRWEEYSLMVTDNVGSAMGGWSPSHPFAARYYKDGRWAWVSNLQARVDDWTVRIANGALARRGIWLGRPDIKPVPPLDMTGMRAFRMDPAWYRELEDVRGKLGVPVEKAYNQIAMRTDFDASNQYARIAGVNIGFHYGGPANAFSVLADKGRTWAVNGRWGMSLMKYYNTVLVTHDGVASRQLPYLCSLETAVDLPSTGFLQSRMPDYNQSDWMRSVVWNKQKYWLVFDDVVAQDAGEYTALCQWRVGSEPQVEDGQAVVGSGSTALVIQSPDDAAAAVAPEDSSHGTAGSYLYRQRRTGTMQPGEVASFRNLVWVQGGLALIDGWKRWQSDDETAAVDDQMPRAGANSLRLVCTGDAWRCLNQRLPILEAGAKYRVSGWVRTNGQVGGRIEVRQANKVVAQAATEAQEWTQIGFEFDAPPEGASAEIWLTPSSYKAAGGVTWFDDIELAKVGGDGADLIVNGGFEAAGDASRTRARYEVRGLADNCAIVSDGKDYWAAGATVDGEPRQFRPAEGLSVTAAAFSISPTELNLAKATALSWEACGLKLSSDRPVSLGIDLTTGVGVAEAPEPCTLTLGKPIVLQAGRQEFRIEPGAAVPVSVGEALWARATLPGTLADADRPGAQLQRQWLTEPAQAQVTSLATADLDGDGKQETVAGFSDGNTVVYSSQGAELSRHKAEKRINDVACVDLDGDGRLEVLSASDDYRLYATDIDGKEVWAFSSEGHEITNKFAGELGVGRYVSSEGEFISIKIADINADGKSEILAGAKCFLHGNRHVYGTLWVLSPEGKQIWHAFNFGGTVDTIDCADIDGDGKLEVVIGTGGGTYGRYTHVIDDDGRQIAGLGAGYGEKRAAFARLTAEGPPAVVRLESLDGTVTAFGMGEGRPQLWEYVSSGLTTYGPLAADLDGDGLDEVLVGGDSGDVYAIDGDGHLLWRRNVGSAVTRLALCERAGGLVIVAGTRGGTLYALDTSGAITGSADAGGPVSSLDSHAGAVSFGTRDGRVGRLHL